jgi:hypothetical protein
MIDDVCDIVKLSYGMCRRILLEELNMRHIAVKFVPRLLSRYQKEHCIAVSSELKEHTENDLNFIFTIITGDESVVYVYDSEMKQQSSQWKTQKSPATQESMISLKQCQIEVDFFFILKELCIRNLFKHYRP